MTDDRTPTTNEPEDDHDYHSQLEVDDTSGWRVFIVPVALIIFVIGGLLFLFLGPDDSGPDPRIANRFGTNAETPAQQAQPEVLEPLTTQQQFGNETAEPGLAGPDPMMNTADTTVDETQPQPPQ